MRAFPYQSTYDPTNNPPWDRLTGAKDHRIEALANWTNGVYPKSGWDVTPGAGMTVLVSPGMGRVQGVFCYDEDTASGGLATESRTLIVQAAHESLDRIDRVIIRHNDNVSVKATDWYILQGTPSASPVAPDLTRNSTIYEIGIAELFIPRGTNAISSQRITDTRLDYNLCGLCTTRVMDKSIDQIKELLRAAIDETVAGNLQNQIDQINGYTISVAATISHSAAVADSTYTDYPYRVDLAVTGCTEDYIPDIYPQADVADVSFSRKVRTTAGTVSVWASNNSFADVSVVIRLTKEV